MNENPVKVLVVSDRAEQWAEMLAEAGFAVCRRRPDAPGPRPDAPGLPTAEVVLTDRAGASLSAWEERETGLVEIAPTGSAGQAAVDGLRVVLPAGAGSREIALACRLLGEIVRLRRRERRQGRLQERLAEQALSDPLTGVPNRRAWDETLTDRLGQRDGRGRLCLAIFDLDHFKHVNDAHGHAAGDEVLRAAAVGLRASLRQGDFVARLGGDEFGLLLDVPDAAAAASVVERVRASLPRRLLRAGAHVVTASAGYCLAPAAADGDYRQDRRIQPQELFERADAALRRAKAEGRDRTVGHKDSSL